LREGALGAAFALARPILHRLDPEEAHHLTLRALRLGLIRGAPEADDPILTTRVFGLDFPNPLGLAAGFDKDAEVVDAMLSLGFGFVEAGTVTPQAQPGNPKPRLFRLDDDRAIINRFGFNSQGLAAFKDRLRHRRQAGLAGVVGANVGKNRDAVDAAADYARGIEELAAVADYLVINVSSPNTPGLRGLQKREEIAGLIGRAMEARARAVAPEQERPPLLAKIAPDLTEAEMRDIGEAAVANGLDGLILGNTTIERPADLRSPHRQEGGGLSGRPLKVRARTCVADMYRVTGGRLPIVGCGGVESGEDAYALIRAGAGLVQLYSALVFHGPALVSDVKRDLAARLRADGFGSAAHAVGADHRSHEAAGVAS
jgi:dihydroorotate dehydrogenase